MNAIQINVNRQMDGYTFSLLPSVRELIRKLIPNARPANVIFVSYDTQSDFEDNYGNLEKYIFPALVGVEEAADAKKIEEVAFVDTHTGTVLHTIHP
jgi:hypothetical protein